MKTNPNGKRFWLYFIRNRTNRSIIPTSVPEEHELLQSSPIKALTKAIQKFMISIPMPNGMNSGYSSNLPEPIKKLWDVKWIKYAAAILILLSSLIYLKVRQTTGFNTSTAQKDFSLAEMKPSLRLPMEGGDRFTDTQNSQLTKESDIIITRSKDGQFVYTMVPSVIPNKTAQIDFNTIETPKGGQYQSTCPDVSKSG